MTIKVTIKNEDLRELAVISVEAQNLDGSNDGYQIEKLKGGESTEVYIYKERKVEIKEISND